MPWSKLPIELQLNVTRNLDRECLKNLRLTSKSLDELAIPYLFETIHLSPNTRSLLRAEEVGRLDHIRKHVKKLVYHVGVLDDDIGGFDTFRNELMKIKKPGQNRDPAEFTAEILWCYSCYLEEVDGQNDFRILDEEYELHELCSKFENLDSIATLMDEYEFYLGQPQDYIGRRTGLPSCDLSSGAHFPNLFKAVSDRPLAAVTAHFLDWEGFPQLEEVDELTRRNCLMNLKELHLGLFNSEFLEHELVNQEDLLTSFSAFLELTPGLTILSLNFDEMPFDPLGNFLAPISATVFRNYWPRLVKLELNGIAAFEDDIVTFLEKHSSTLQILHLGDIELTNIDDENIEDDLIAFPDSFISLFMKIHGSLKLLSVTLSGIFTNRISEAWYVDTDHGGDESPICLQIESFLSHQILCPFPDWLIKLTIASSASLPSNMNFDSSSSYNDKSKFNEIEDWSDSSWVWSPELL